MRFAPSGGAGAYVEQYKATATIHETNALCPLRWCGGLRGTVQASMQQFVKPMRFAPSDGAGAYVEQYKAAYNNS
jgi:hypothetical protein